jgi:hypothetical protein
MKRTTITSTLLLSIAISLLLAVTYSAFGQDRGNRPVISDDTKREVNEKTEQVKQNAQELGQDIKQEVQQQAGVARERNDRLGLPWFDKGTWFGGGSVGFGLGKGSGGYFVLEPRAGYFFQPGFAAGIKLGYDRRLSTSFRSNQFGLFTRYYPFRTRVSSFLGVGYNFGRERASNIDADDKARYNSINLEIGAMFYVLKNVGVESTLETNYYDRSNPLAGRNRGGRIKFGVNYYFARPGR